MCLIVFYCHIKMQKLVNNTLKNIIQKQRLMMKQKHQQTLKSLYLQGFRQKNRTLKIVSFIVSYGGCGGRDDTHKRPPK